MACAGSLPDAGVSDPELRNSPIFDDGADSFTWIWRRAGVFLMVIAMRRTLMSVTATSYCIAWVVRPGS